MHDLNKTPTPFRQKAVETNKPDLWAKHVADSVVPLAFVPHNPDTFRGRMSTTPAPRGSATLIEAKAHDVTRQLEYTEQDENPIYKISFQLDGIGKVMQDGREASTEPGDLVIYDTSRPYQLSFDDDMRALYLMVTPESLGLKPYEIEDLTAVKFPAGSTLNNIISPLLTEISRNPALFGAATNGRLASNAIDLMNTVLRTTLDTRTVRTQDETEMIRLRAQRLIERNIHHPNLGPKMIADAMFMSVRSLYAAFEGSEKTVATIIRETRLEGAMRDLTSPDKVGETIGSIANKWMFSDSGNFSRAFKAHFGMTPKHARDLITGSVS